MALEELRLIETQIAQLDQEIAILLRQHHDAVHRLAQVPGLGVDSAQQIFAEVGATAATFPSPKHLASWVGACPGEEESAGVATLAKGLHKRAGDAFESSTRLPLFP
jgi:transposase